MAEYKVPICGGLGDAILRCLLPGDVGCIEDLKRKDPQARVRCELLTTNPYSAEFVAPWFDTVVARAWDGDRRAFAQRTSTGRIDPSLYRWERPEIELSADERALVDGLGKFIAVHPFAGTVDRDCSSLISMEALIDALCDAGHTVVLLGGSSVRVEGKENVTTRTLVEECEYERPRLVNLVNLGSVRLQAYLAAHASKFVGSFSCYHCAAFALDVPSLVLAGRAMEPFFSCDHPVYGRMSEREATQIHYFEDGDLIGRILRFAKESN